MSEDFKNYLDSHMVIGSAEVGTKSADKVENVENKAEELPAPPEEINIDIPETDAEETDSADNEEELDEVVTEKVATPQAPKVKENPNGTYHGIFLPVCNTTERIKAELLKRAETDEELDKAIKEGKKTFEGCDRFIRNSMSDLAREMKAKELTMDDDSVHEIAVWYFKNPYATDVQNAVKSVAKAKEDKPKKEPKPKAEKKEKKTEVVPLTPAMGSLFGDDDF